MRKPTFTNTLLSLFSTPKRAEEIEGDFLEEENTDGKIWHTLLIANTIFDLYRQALMQAPFKTLLCSALLAEGLFLNFWWITQSLNRGTYFGIDTDIIIVATLFSSFFLAGVFAVKCSFSQGARVVLTTVLMSLLIWMCILATSMWDTYLKEIKFIVIQLLTSSILLVILTFLPIILGGVLTFRKQQLKNLNQSQAA